MLCSRWPFAPRLASSAPTPTTAVQVFWAASQVPPRAVIALFTLGYARAPIIRRRRHATTVDDRPSRLERFYRNSCHLMVVCFCLVVSGKVLLLLLMIMIHLRGLDDLQVENRIFVYFVATFQRQDGRLNRYFLYVYQYLFKLVQLNGHRLLLLCACLIITGQSIWGVMMTVIAAVEKRETLWLRSTSSNYPIYAELIYGQQNGLRPGKERRLAVVQCAAGVPEVLNL